MQSTSITIGNQVTIDVVLEENSNRLAEADVAVKFPTNTSTEAMQTERLIYPTNELMTNSNAPQEPDLFAKTEVNK